MNIIQTKIGVNHYRGNKDTILFQSDIRFVSELRILRDRHSIRHSKLIK